MWRLQVRQQSVRARFDIATAAASKTSSSSSSSSSLATFSATTSLTFFSSTTSSSSSSSASSSLTVTDRLELSCCPHIRIHRVAINGAETTDWKQAALPTYDSHTTSEDDLKREAAEFQRTCTARGLSIALREREKETLRRADGAELRVEIAYSIPPNSLPAGLSFNSSKTRIISCQNFGSSTKSWLPCIEQSSCRCKWDLQFVVPRNLTVLATGDLKEPVEPVGKKELLFHFECNEPPISALSLSFVVGEFRSWTDPEEPVIRSYCVPGQERLLATSAQFLSKAFQFFDGYLGTYPFNTYQQVFLPDAEADVAGSGAGMSVFCSSLLHSSAVIEQPFATRTILTRALVRQWIDHMVVVEPADEWLVAGISSYVANQFLREMFGNNHVKYQLKQDMEQVCHMDTDQPPLYCPDPTAVRDDTFVSLKATLVIHVLEHIVGKESMKEAITEILDTDENTNNNNNNNSNNSNTGNTGNNNNREFLRWNTQQFLTLLDQRTTRNGELENAANNWIYRNGCPVFQVKFEYSKKKNVVLFEIKQESTNPNSTHTNPAADSDAFSSSLDAGAQNKFKGSLTIRVNETEGTYDHVIAMEDVYNKHEFPFHSRAKRVRRKKVKGEWDIPQPQTNIHHCWDWKDLEADIMEDTPVLWLRVDPDMDWICTFVLGQPPFRWRHQLHMDKDVVGQYLAIQALKKIPSRATSGGLMRALTDHRIYYRVRMEAAYALAACATPNLRYVGLKQLQAYYYVKFALGTVSNESELRLEPNELAMDGPPPPIHPVDMQSHLSEPVPMREKFHISVGKPNQFQKFIDYFVVKAMAEAPGSIRDEYNRCPAVAMKFILALLRYSDNSYDEYDDSEYVAALLGALGECFNAASDDVSGTGSSTILPVHLSEMYSTLTRLAAVEFERFLLRDRFRPSYHNVVTCQALQGCCAMQQYGFVDLHLQLFLDYTRYGHFFTVRKTAISSLVSLAVSNPHVLSYLLSLIVKDPSPRIRRFVCQSLSASVTSSEPHTRQQYETLRANIKNSAPNTVEYNLVPLVRNIYYQVALGNESLAPHLVPLVAFMESCRVATFKLIDRPKSTTIKLRLRVLQEEADQTMEGKEESDAAGYSSASDSDKSDDDDDNNNDDNAMPDRDGGGDGGGDDDDSGDSDDDSPSNENGTTRSVATGSSSSGSGSSGSRFRVAFHFSSHR